MSFSLECPPFDSGVSQLPRTNVISLPRACPPGNRNVHHFHPFSLHPLESVTVPFPQMSHVPAPPWVLHTSFSLSLASSSVSPVPALAWSNPAHPSGLTLDVPSTCKLPPTPKTARDAPVWAQGPVNLPSLCCHCAFGLRQAVNPAGAHAGSALPVGKSTEPPTAPYPHQVLSKH